MIFKNEAQRQKQPVTTFVAEEMYHELRKTMSDWNHLILEKLESLELRHEARDKEIDEMKSRLAGLNDEKAICHP